MTHELTKHYTGDYFFEELRGISDAAQVDYKTMRRVHLIGELTKGHCSMVGAWVTICHIELLMIHGIGQGNIARNNIAVAILGLGRQWTICMPKTRHDSFFIERPCHNCCVPLQWNNQ